MWRSRVPGLPRNKWIIFFINPHLECVRKKNLKRALDQEVILAGAWVLITQGAGVLAAEGLGLDPREKTGVLGTIITDMPKRRDIAIQMAEKANQHLFQQGGSPPASAQVEWVNPFRTSQYCARCRKKLKGTTDYDTQTCPTHGKLNRHGNAAQVIAKQGVRKLQKMALSGIF